MNKTVWFKSYYQWEKDCLEEWNAKHKDDRILGDGPNGIEFGENGTAYLHGIGGTTYVKCAVTSWWTSKHYQP